jgi:chromosome segregation ATPase
LQGKIDALERSLRASEAVAHDFGQTSARLSPSCSAPPSHRAASVEALQAELARVRGDLTGSRAIEAEKRRAVQAAYDETATVMSEYEARVAALQRDKAASERVVDGLEAQNAELTGQVTAMAEQIDALRDQLHRAVRERDTITAQSERQIQTLRVRLVFGVASWFCSHVHAGHGGGRAGGGTTGSGTYRAHAEPGTSDLNGG